VTRAAYFARFTHRSLSGGVGSPNNVNVLADHGRRFGARGSTENAFAYQTVE